MRDPFDKNDVQSLITCFSWRQVADYTFEVHDKTKANVLGPVTSVGKIYFNGKDDVRALREDKQDYTSKTLIGAFCYLIAEAEKSID